MRLTRKMIVGLALALVVAFAAGLADAVSTGPLPEVAQPPVAEVSGCPDGAEGAACNRWSCKYVPCCPWMVCDDGWCVE